MKKWNLYFGFAMLLACVSVSAAPQHALEKLDLFPYFAVLEDKTGDLTFEQVKKRPDHDFIKPPGKNFVATHPDKAVYWIKIDLKNAAHIFFDADPVLYIPYREFTSLTYYQPLADGSYKHYQIGRAHGLAQKDVTSPHIAFRSSQNGWNNMPIYFRADFRDYTAASTLPAFLYSQAAFSTKAQLLAIGAIATYAIFFTMLVYNLSFYLAIREKFFAFYIVYLASSWIVCMGNDGIWASWIIRSNDSLASRTLDAITILGCICAYLAFVVEILQVKKYMPWIIWPVRTVFFYGATASAAILAGVDQAQYHFINKGVVGAYCVVFSLTIFFVSLYKKVPYAWIVAPATITLSTLGGIYSGYLNGSLTYNEYLPWMMSTGFVLEILVISVMVALKIRHIIRERESAKLASRLAQRNADQQQQLATEKSRFLAHVGHDMRQPLYVLRLQLALLKTKVIEPALLSTVTAMKSSIDSIEAMFDDILYMSQLESGGIVPEKELIVMAELLQTICSEFRTEADNRNIRLVTFCTHGAEIHTDKQIVKRILRNLVQNALRHTESGGVLIACRRRGEVYRIDVIDSGFGIDKLSQEKLFKPSKKIPGSQTLTGNFGLGLSIVATLSGLINASIEVQSAPGKGSRFSIYLHA